MTFALLFLALAWLGAGPALPRAVAAGRTVRINLGTLAPRGSIFHQALQVMGEKWKQASNGKVRLVIYPDGTQGGESDMVRLMRIGTLHAGLLTAVGLADIDRSVTGLQAIPMAFHDLAEYEYVHEKMRAKLEKHLRDKGFVVLFWGDAGWVRFFSKEPMLHPQELKHRKVFVWAGNTKQVDIMKKYGYDPVPLETGEILTGLQTGLIDALSVPPIFALAGQLDLRAPHMLKLNWAPLVGAAVVTEATWSKIPPETRQSLLESAAEAGREIQANSRKENTEAVAAMQKRGLTIHPVDDALEAEWRQAAEQLYPDIRGSLVPSDIFDEVRQLLQEYRKGAGGQLK
jgi:TRAP-type transport system periplasmic protein